ncbi:acetoacetyl-CoA reductase [Bradyrhizobium barranii subsp. barranii]
MARVALVTGGTRGIGAAISKALKAAGYKVAASYAGNDAAAEKFKAETGIAVYKWDVSNFDACAEGVKKVEAELGPVDVLVNNAGITRDTAFHKMTLEQWNAVINTNLGSLFNMTRQVIEGMRARKFGRVISISSINGQKGQFGQVNYSAAKAGDIGFTKALAIENAKGGITVNAIAPGYINTEMVQAVPKDVLEKNVIPADPGQPARRTRGDRARRGVPCRRRGRLHHRLDADHQWRPVSRLTGRQACRFRRDKAIVKTKCPASCRASSSSESFD